LLTWRVEATEPGSYHEDSVSYGDELAFAARGGNVVHCAELLDAGHNPAANGAAALHWACELGHEPVVRRLLLDSRLLGGDTGGRVGKSAVSEALLTACAAGYAGIVHALLANGAQLDVRLPFSCMNSLLRGSAEDSGIDLNRPIDCDQWLWDDLPAERLVFLAEDAEELEAQLELAIFHALDDDLQEAIDSGSVPPIQSRWGGFIACALGVAARTGSNDVIELLLEHAGVRAANGDFAILVACLAGHTSAADRLLEFFFPRESASRSRLRHMDPIFHALVFYATCMGGDTDLMRIVVQRDPSLIDTRPGGRWLGRTGVGLAAMWMNPAVVRFLLSCPTVLDACAKFRLGRKALEAVRDGAADGCIDGVADLWGIFGALDQP